MQDLKFKETSGHFNPYQDLALDRPEMKFTSGLGLKVILIQQRRGMETRRRVNLKLYTGNSLRKAV